MYQHTDTKPTKKGAFFHSKEDYSDLNLLIECNTNNKKYSGSSVGIGQFLMWQLSQLRFLNKCLEK